MPAARFHLDLQVEVREEMADIGVKAAVSVAVGVLVLSEARRSELSLVSYAVT
jgi:hypothetical protein